LKDEMDISLALELIS